MTWFRLRRTCEPSRAEVGKPTTLTITAASHDPEGRGHHCGISPASQLKAYEPEANAERLFRPIVRRDRGSAHSRGKSSRTGGTHDLERHQIRFRLNRLTDETRHFRAIRSSRRLVARRLLSLVRQLTSRLKRSFSKTEPMEKSHDQT
jgi:hypothetical protein